MSLKFPNALEPRKSAAGGKLSGNCLVGVVTAATVNGLESLGMALAAVCY
jgi:hypothetical protein